MGEEVDARRDGDEIRATKELGSIGPTGRGLKENQTVNQLVRIEPITGNRCHTQRSPQLPSFRVINVGARLKTVIYSRVAAYGTPTLRLVKQGRGNPGSLFLMVDSNATIGDSSAYS